MGACLLLARRAGLVVNEIVGVADGFLPVGPLVPVCTLQTALTVLFLVAHGMARRADASPLPVGP